MQYQGGAVSKTVDHDRHRLGAPFEQVERILCYVPQNLFAPQTRDDVVNGLFNQDSRDTQEGNMSIRAVLETI